MAVLLKGRRAAAAADFDDLYRRASRARIGGADVPIASIDDLIAMNRAAGRPRDVEDIEVLLRLKAKHERN